MAKQSKKYEIPMEVTTETIRDFNIDPKCVVSCTIGNRRKQCVMIPCSEEVHKMYTQMEDAERKRMDRAGRCMIKGKYGKLIRCPENNKCSECPNAHLIVREENKPASIEYMVEHSIEPAVEDPSMDAVLNEMCLNDLIKYLSKIKPIYGKIFHMLYNQKTQDAIGREIGMPQRTVSDNIEKIRSILRPKHKEIFEH